MPQDDVHRQALADARQLHLAGAGTVLDVLARATPVADLPALWAWMAACGGARAAPDPGAALAVPEVLPEGMARALACTALRFPDEPEFRIGLADPWDDERVGDVARRLGRMPLLAAVGGTLLPPGDPTTPSRRTDPTDPAHGRVGRPFALSAGPAIEPLPERPSSQPPGQRPAIEASGAWTSTGGVVVEFVDAALRWAHASGASDVHFECDRTGVTVRCRLDGVMQAFSRLEDRRRADEVISRIKVLAQLDITESRIPQDGRFRFVLPASEVDLRVSIMPSVHGEDAVLRLLDKAQLRGNRQAITLEQLGFAPDLADTLRELADLPHGMLLVTGPTGSGKTTTVYAVLSEVHRGLEKIVTIEDPVEYELAGVLQIPVNDRKGLSFARGLRSILRHDPDRILVGEIRDAETAEIAVQSALTGHQVYTTVHANSLLDVIGRFRHFGLDMHGFMSALNGVVVQRLMRVVCRACAATRRPGHREVEWLAACGHTGAGVPEAVGCDACRGSGYQGRGVLAEVHAIDDALRDLVTGHASLSQLRERIDRGGLAALQRQAAAMVAAGITTFEEIRRVVGWR